MAPVSMLDSAKPRIWQIVLVGIPALLGLGLWIAGCRHLLADRRLAWRALALVATLVTLPWWSRALAHSLRFLYDPAENALAGFAAGVATPPPRLVLRDPDWHGESDDVLRPINPATSRYADILGGLVIRKPDGAPSEDDLLRELSESIAAQVELWPDERIVPMLIALDHHARLADHSADFLVLDAVRRASLDERRSPGLRETASNVLFWVALGAAPRPDEVAGAERMKLWEALYDHPDPAVRNVARK